MDGFNFAPESILPALEVPTTLFQRMSALILNPMAYRQTSTKDLMLLADEIDAVFNPQFSEAAAKQQEKIGLREA